MTLRDLTTDDLPIVLEINEANVPAVSQVSADDLAELLRMASVALVAETDGRVVGFCIVLPPGAPYASPNYRYFADRYDSFAYLDRVALADGYRRSGIGTQMYAEVERRVDADWFALEVNVQPRNDVSLRFHDRAGFTEVGRHESHPGTIVSLMVKPLR